MNPVNQLGGEVGVGILSGAAYGLYPLPDEGGVGEPNVILTGVGLYLNALEVALILAEVTPC